MRALPFVVSALLITVRPPAWSTDEPQTQKPCGGATAAYAQDPLRVFFPPSGYQNWLAVPRSHACGSGEGLTEVYDGGYKEYLDAGVLQASKQTYKKKDVLADLILHKMQSEPAAKAFYDRQLQLAGKEAKPAPKPWTAFTWSAAGCVYGFLCTRDYYLSSALTADDPQSALALMQEIARRTNPPSVLAKAPAKPAQVQKAKAAAKVVKKPVKKAPLTAKPKAKAQAKKR